MASAAVRFSVVADARDLHRVFAVRAIVFIEEQACPFDEEFDEYDQIESSAVHILGSVDHAGGSEPVASGRIRLMQGGQPPERTAKLERLAIRPGWRAGGAGHRLLTFMIHTARSHGCTRFILHAQSHLTGFYESHGFVVNGPHFVEAGIDHAPMIWRPHNSAND